jgi:prophage endopeptidase
MNRLVILLIACVAYVGSVMVGYGIGRTDGKAICKGDQAAALTKARKDDIAALQAAKDHGDTLTAQLQIAQTTLITKEQEVRNALASKTTGRACLSGDVVRLLNHPAEDRSASVSAPAAIAAATDGAAATDVAQWANTARTQYDLCRTRLNALIDW